MNEDCGRILRSKSTILLLIWQAFFKRRNGFPWEWERAEPGKPISEGGVIERQGASHYVYRAQRSHPTNRGLLAEQTEKLFSTSEEAARYYLKWDLNLPGNLDGWTVVP